MNGLLNRALAMFICVLAFLLAIVVLPAVYILELIPWLRTIEAPQLAVWLLATVIGAAFLTVAGGLVSVVAAASWVAGGKGRRWFSDNGEGS